MVAFNPTCATETCMHICLGVHTSAAFLTFLVVYDNQRYKKGLGFSVLGSFPKGPCTY